jgi:hypothetical protein
MNSRVLGFVLFVFVLFIEGLKNSAIVAFLESVNGRDRRSCDIIPFCPHPATPPLPARQQTFRSMSLLSTSSAPGPDRDVRVHELEQSFNSMPLADAPARRVASFGELPSEVFVMICEYLLDRTQPYPLVPVMQICSFAYSVVVSTPHLWTALHGLQSREWRELCIARAQGLRLHVHWDYRESTPPTTNTWIAEIFPVASSASINVLDFASTDFHAFLSAPAPFMRSLAMSTGGWRSFSLTLNLLGGQLHNLRTLELDSMEISRDRNVHGPWSFPALINLTLMSCTGYLEHLYDILCAMPHLEVLKLVDTNKYHSTTWTSTHTRPLSPVVLPRLRTVFIDGQLRDIALILSFIPNPSHHFSVSTDSWVGGTPREHSIVTCRMQDFWQTATGSHVLPLLHLILVYREHPGWDAIDSWVECGHEARSSADKELSRDSSSPSLFLRLFGKLESTDLRIIPMVITLDFHLNNVALGLRKTDAFDIDHFTSLQHVIIRQPWWLSEQSSSYLEKDQEDLLEWIGQRVDDGRPLQSITFELEDMEPRPDFTRKLLAAGGDVLRIVWQTKPNVSTSDH